MTKLKWHGWSDLLEALTTLLIKMNHTLGAILLGFLSLPIIFQVSWCVSLFFYITISNQLSGIYTRAEMTFFRAIIRPFIQGKPCQPWKSWNWKFLIFKISPLKTTQSWKLLFRAGVSPEKRCHFASVNPILERHQRIWMACPWGTFIPEMLTEAEQDLHWPMDELTLRGCS